MLCNGWIWGGQGILWILIFLELWMGLGMGILSFLELYIWLIIFGRLCKITIVSKKYLVLEIGNWKYCFKKNVL